MLILIVISCRLEIIPMFVRPRRFVWNAPDKMSICDMQLCSRSWLLLVSWIIFSQNIETIFKDRLKKPQKHYQLKQKNTTKIKTDLPTCEVSRQKSVPLLFIYWNKKKG